MCSKNVFKGPLCFHKNIREGYTTLEKAKEQQNELKLELNDIVKGGKKSEDHNK